MRAPQQPRAAATVDAIVIAAERVVDREGAGALTTNRVAEVAGVSIGTLYQYFPNKESLVGELLDRQTAMFRRAVETVFAQHARGTVAEIVDAATAELLRTYHTQRPVHHQLFELRRLPEVHARIERSLDATAAVLEAFLRARPDLRVDDPRSAAFIIVRAVDGVLVTIADRKPDAELPTLLRELGKLIVRYVG